MKASKNILIFLSVLLSVILPSSAFAFSCPGGITVTNIACNIGNVIGIIAVIIVVIFWVITGILFLIAQGDPSKLGTAKKAVIYSVVGTVVAFLAGTAITIIGNAVLYGA